MSTLTATLPPPPSATRNRIQSIDIVRGIVMVIMALDHVRDFFHETASLADPTNMNTTTPGLFFTRWITHFCAPTFVFLSGTSAFLMGRKRTKQQLSLFLITRGLWLLLIETFVISLAWTFDPLYHIIIYQVIWAIGCSMIVLGILVFLPLPLIFIIGLTIVCGHNILDSFEATRNHQVGFWWNLLHHTRFNFYPIAGSGNNTHGVLLVYAFMPWAGVMLLGYCFGKLFTPEVSAETRQKWLVPIGLSLVALFVILRYWNGYGDPAPWHKQKDGLFTFLSFLNTTKYPPSLLYLLMTLGPSILALALVEKVQNRFTETVKIFGRVPFFYYVLHFYLIHTLTVIAFFIAGYGAKDIAYQNSPFLFRPDHFGYPLWGVYLVWLLVVVTLYPLCKWYNRYKSTHTQWWLSYL